MDEAATKQKFLDTMRSRDLVLREELIADGKVHRCGVVDKKGDSGSYPLRLDGPAAWGWYRNWTDGEETTYWRDERHRALTDAEREELERHIEEARIKAEELAAERAKEAALKANELWDRAGDVIELRAGGLDRYPYLKRKQIKPHGVRVDQDGCLLVPIRDQNNELLNLQRIYPDGRKYFLFGGRVKGCAFVIEGRIDTEIVVEGFATGASIHEATGATVTVAFNASNLVEVARTIRNGCNTFNKSEWKKREQMDADAGLQAEHRHNAVDLKLVIAADDDWKRDNNPGIMKGLAASRDARALIAVPKFGKDRGDEDTDFNDLAKRYGLECVKEQLEKAVEPQVLLRRRLLADPFSALSAAMVAELAAWKRYRLEVFGSLRAELQEKKVNMRDFDRAIKDRIKDEDAKAAATRNRKRPVEQVNPEALAKSAAQIIESPNVLDLFATEFAKIFAGESNNAKLLYLIGTSRLFELKKTMHCAVKGTSAGR